MDTRTVFSKRLFALREERGYKRQKVADDLGITRATLEYYEKGQRLPDIETLAKIADYYNVPADYLLGRLGAKSLDIEMQAICEYTGLSERAIKRLKSDFSLNDKSDSIKDHKIEWAETANRIIEEGFLFRFASKMAELANISEYYSNTFFDFEPNEMFELAEKFNIDEILFADLLFNRSFKFQENTPVPDKYAVGDGIIGNIQEQCDLCRYALIKYAESISNMFDRRKGWKNYTREQLLEYLNITEDQLKELQAEAERLNKRDAKRRAKDGKHNSPKE